MSRRRTWLAGIAALAMVAVAASFAFADTVGNALAADKASALISVSSLRTDHKTYSINALVTVKAQLEFDRRVWSVRAIVLAVRNEGGQAFDFPVLTPDDIVDSGGAIEQSRPFSRAGEYKVSVAYLHNGRWREVEGSYSFFVESDSSALPPAADSPVATTTPGEPPAPTPTSVAPPSGSSLLTGSTPKAEVIGISPGARIAWGSAETLAADLDRAVATRATRIRIDIPWTQIEGTKGNPDWEPFDRLVDQARARQLRVIGIVGTLAPWARPPGTDWRWGASTDEQRAGFANFAKAAARRYQGKIAAWEIWNEPNLSGSWAPSANAGDYAKLMKLAYAAIHEGVPGVPVITGGTGGGAQAGTGSIPTVSWYESLYASGVKAYSDAVAVHPYSNFLDVDGVNTGEMAAAFQVRKIMDTNGDLAKQLWGTEVGAPTGGAWSTDEAGQAALVSKSYDLWSTIHDHGPLFYYTINDFDAGGDREGYFGLYRIDGTPKPSLAALQAWAQT